MSEAGRGLPLLSGPPPSPDTMEMACRKCNKDFVPLIVRHRKCNHCGYSFCHSCTDYQALMPRENGYGPMNICGFCIEYLTITAAGRAQLKAMPISRLRNYINAYNIQTVDRIVEKDDLIDAIVKARGPNGCLPPDNEAYYRKYSIPNKISPGRSRGFFSTSRQGQNTNPRSPPPKPPPRPPPPEFARPDLQPDDPQPGPPPRQSYPNAPRPGEPLPQRQQQQQYAPPPFPPPPQPQRPSSPPGQQYRPPPRPHSAFGYTAAPPQFHTPGYGWHAPNFTPGPPPPPPHFTRPTAQSDPPPPPPQFTRPTAQPSPQPAPPPPPPSTRPGAASNAPPPTLDQLITMPTDSIRGLSISVLKSILFANHVNVTNVLEKADLVSRVIALVEDEKKEQERMRMVGEMEEMERAWREMEVEGVGVETNVFPSSASMARDEAEHVQVINSETSSQEHPADRGTDSSEELGTQAQENTPSKPEPRQPRAKASPTSLPALERSGLCVVCQDEEANIAIVDCGHLAMCRTCSDLIMSSSKECPLCRTRIVTEARLLRIFKT